MKQPDDLECLLCSFHGRECIFPQSPIISATRPDQHPVSKIKSSKISDLEPWSVGPSFSTRKIDCLEVPPPPNHSTLDQPSGVQLDDTKNTEEIFLDKHWVEDPFSLEQIGGTPMAGSKESNMIVSLPDYDTLEDSSLHKTLGLHCNRFLSYVGPTGELESSVLGHCSFNEKNILPLSSDISEEWNSSLDQSMPYEKIKRRSIVGSIRCVNKCDSPYREVESFVVLQDKGRTGVHAENMVDLNPESVAEMQKLQDCIGTLNPELMNTFIKYVLPFYPIIHKTTLMDKFGRSVYELTPSILASIYSIALNWAAYEGSLNIPTLPSRRILSCMSFEFFTREIGYPTLSTVQTGLLLLQQHDILQESPRSACWLLISQLVGASYELGLHIDCNNWEIPQWEKKLRRRLAWAVFMEDKWWALTAGRPSFIQSNNWDVPDLSTHNEFGDLLCGNSTVSAGCNEAFGIYDGVLFYAEMIKLTKLLSDILETLYSSRELHNFTDTRGTAEMEKQLLQELGLANSLRTRMSAWYSQLSRRLRVEETKTGQLCPNANLHIGYFVLAMTLFRRLIKFLSRTGVEDFLELKMQVYKASFNLLSHTVTFIANLKLQHLKAFWFGFVKRAFALIPTFGFLLFASVNDLQFKVQCLEKIEELRWFFLVNQSAGALFMKSSISWIDQYYNILRPNILAVRQAYKRNAS